MGGLQGTACCPGVLPEGLRRGSQAEGVHGVDARAWGMQGLGPTPHRALGHGMQGLPPPWWDYPPQGISPSWWLRELGAAATGGS